MISHSKKLILILPPKTGGTSVLSELLQYGLVYEKFQQKHGGFDYYESLSDKQLDIKAKHKPLCEYEDYIKTYKLYGIARNPYSRMVSWWRFREPNKPFKQWLDTFGNNPFQLKRTSAFQRMTYKDYFQVTERAVDNIIHTENLQTGFDLLCDDIGISRRQLSCENKTNHKHYTEYYDDETREKVSQKYAQDIEHFGYKFGE